MSDKIFENYIDKCPVCGAELDAHNDHCAYCGAKLEVLNTEYHNVEQQIHDARADIQEAKELIENREVKYKEAKKSRINIWKIIVIVCLVLIAIKIAIVVGAGMIMASVESEFDRDRAAFCQELLSKDVGTIIAEDFNESEYEFVDFGKSNVAGCIQQSENYLKFPFRSSNSSNTLIVNGNVIIDADKLDEIYTYKDDMTSTYLDDCRILISWYATQFYENSTDFLDIYDREDFENITRCDNYVVGDITFECYLSTRYSTEEYILVANPYRDCFIVIEIENRRYNEKFDFEDAINHIIHVQAEYSIQ